MNGGHIILLEPGQLCNDGSAHESHTTVPPLAIGAVINGLPVLRHVLKQESGTSDGGAVIAEAGWLDILRHRIGSVKAANSDACA